MINRFILTPFFLDQPELGLEPLVEPDWVINKPRLPDGTSLKRMAVLYEPLAELVHLAIRQGERPVSIAGDCCTSLGVLGGLQRAELEPTLIWFDAHGDFNTYETTPSGFLGGMPLAMLVGRGEGSIVQSLDLDPLPEERVILSDGRDLDPGERGALAGSDILHLPDVIQLLNYDLPPGPLWVHFDTDVIDLETGEIVQRFRPAKDIDLRRKNGRKNNMISIEETSVNSVRQKVVRCGHCKTIFWANRHQQGSTFFTTCRECGHYLVGNRYDVHYECGCDDCVEKAWWVEEEKQ